jgi:NAD(P)-dependent dehydrogenase (short-subunit alcohol dehydrogenase family)
VSAAGHPEHVDDPLASFAPGLFRGRVALVTGGGSGIGREIALGFARYGADVIVASRNEENLRATAAEVDALRCRCLVVPTNIRDVAQVDHLRDAAYDAFGRVDFVVNNAGGQFPAPPSQITDNGWRAVIDLNLNGTWNVISRFMKPMTAAGFGAIVNVIHVYSFDRGAPSFAHSGAARAGVLNLTRTLAPYLGQFGVTINALAPGSVATPGLTEHEITNLGLTEDAFNARYAAVSPLGRLGRPGEIAAAVLFLCSPAARFVTGTALVADGAELRTNWVEFYPKGTL